MASHSYYAARGAPVIIFITGIAAWLYPRWSSEAHSGAWVISACGVALMIIAVVLWQERPGQERS